MDMEGMDQSWNSSQWVSLRGVTDRNNSNDESDSEIPQLDGLTDDKSKCFLCIWLLYIEFHQLLLAT